MREKISSRKNPLFTHIRKLNRDKSYRHECGQFVCEGYKLLEECLLANTEIFAVIVKEKFELMQLNPAVRVVEVSSELMENISEHKSAPDVVFVCKLPDLAVPEDIRKGSYIVLDRLQDPGNVGTVVRTADAFGIDGVILVNNCADPFAPKTVRSTMGSIFRQRIFETDFTTAVSVLRKAGLNIYAACLSNRAETINNLKIETAAVVIGNEGAGVSEEIISACDGEIIIPMRGQSESLNAAVAAGIVMWEMVRGVT